MKNSGDFFFVALVHGFHVNFGARIKKNITFSYWEVVSSGLTDASVLACDAILAETVNSGVCTSASYSFDA